MNIFTRIWSYITPITLKKYHSQYSGILYVSLENGKKVLNTTEVNYSFNSLHRVFQQAFRKTDLEFHHDAKVLLLGLGAGSVVHIIRKEYSSIASIVAVEIDPVVIEIAKTEFGIEQLQPVRLVLEDAYQFINHNHETFDLICVDLFIQDKVPDKFLSSGFIARLLAALESNGRIYFNYMDGSALLTAKFNQMLEELATKGEHPVSINQFSLEENNKVLVVTK